MPTEEPAGAERREAAPPADGDRPQGPAGRGQQVRPPRWPFRLLIVSIVLATATSGLFGWAYLTYNDERLARQVMKLLNAQIRGRLKVASIHWEARTLADLALGTPSPIVVRDARFFDPAGTEVIRAARVDARIDLWSLIARGQVRVTSVKVRDGHCLVAEMGASHNAEIGIAETFLEVEESAPGSGAPLMLFENVDIDRIGFRLRVSQTEISIPRVKVRARMRLQGHPDKDGMVIKGKVSAPRGTFTQSGMKMQVRAIRAERTGIDGHTVYAKPLQLKVGDAAVRVEGGLRHLFDKATAFAATARISGGAKLLSRLTRLPLAGELHATVQATGPVREPILRASVTGLRAKMYGVQISGVQGEATLDAGKQQIAVRSARADVLDGVVHGRGNLDLATRKWRGAVRLDALDPAPLAPQLGGRLDGQVAVSGELAAMLSGLAVVDLSLARRSKRYRDPIPKRLALKGSVHLSPKIIDLAGMSVTGDGNRLKARGSINLAQHRSNLFVKIEAPRLGSWLGRQLGFRPVSAAGGTLHVSGPLLRPRVKGELQARQIGYGNLLLDRANVKLSFSNGTLHVEEISSKGFGGKIGGKGWLKLFDGPITRLRRRPLIKARVTANEFVIERLTKLTGISGRADASVTLSGPVDNITGMVNVAAPGLSLFGDRYSVVKLRAGLLGDRISIYDAVVQRERGGGSLRAWGDVHFDGELGLRLRARGFPLRGIPGVEQAPVAVTGEIDGALRVGGKISDPRAAGTLALSGVTVRGAKLGDGEIVLSSEADGIGLRGNLLAGAIGLRGSVLLNPRQSAHLTVDLEKIPIESFAPEMRSFGDLRGIASGRITLDLDADKGLSWINARMSELIFTIRHRPLGRREYRVLRLSNREDLLVTYDGRRVHVVTARMASSVPGGKQPQAQFDLGGFLSDKSDLRLRGEVPLTLLQFFFPRRVKRIRGSARADVRVTGPLGTPQLTGKLALSGVSVRLPRFDRAVEIPSARVVLVPGALRVDALKLRVGDAQLSGKGKVKLRGLRPVELALSVAGDFNVRLLQLMFPEQLTLARGRARVALAVRGPVRDPQLTGDLQLGKVGRKVYRAELIPRGLGRTITLKDGELRLRGYHLETSRTLLGTYDEGQVRLSGSARFDRGELVDLYLKVKGTGIPQRKPGAYSAELNADLELLGDGERLMLKGGVDVVDGRYVRQFDIVKQAVIKPRVSEESTPFWKGNKLLEQLALDLRIRTTGQLKVKNRYANLALETRLDVGGTLSRTTLHGNVRVETGEFSIPFLRGQFKVERGEIVFDRGKPIDEARIDIEAETQHIDSGGTDYTVRLHLIGPLNSIRIELTSDPPLKQGQILALLATGRTTEQLRADLRGGKQGRGARGDAQVKALTGQFLSGMVEDQLKQAFGLDLVRLEVGTESVAARVCKKLGAYVNVCGKAEQDLIGGSFLYQGWGNLKLHDYVRLEGKMERLPKGLEREKDNPSRLRIELKLRYPIR